MSDYAFVADRARKVFASVSRLESELARSPDDWSVQRNLRSMQKLAAQARAELERLASANQIEICEYRMVPQFGSEYGLSHIARSLLGYQNLFSQIYDAMKNGPKSRAVIGPEAEAESMLDFGYSYSGSLGVALLARSERDFFDGNLDRPIEALYQVLDIDDIDAVKDISATLGRAVVKRIHDWSSATAEGGFSADIKWKRSDGRLLGQMIDRTRLVNIANYISATADQVTTPVRARGMLVGGDMESKSFHFTVPDGDSYRGHISTDAALPPELTLGRIYDAEISVAETYYYATDRLTKSNTLVRLVGPLAADLAEQDSIES